MDYKGVMCAAKEINTTFHSLELKEKQKFQKQFLKECSLSQKIAHPNIVRCFGIYYPTRDSFPVMVMELMDESLTTYLKNQNAVNLIKSISILHDVAVGLSFLHSRNPPIIHGDLCSANIILKCTGDGMLPIAKIANLGMAKVMGPYNKNAKTKLSQFCGTAFIPPEKKSLLKECHEHAASTDIFSIGCVALHIFSHKCPIPVTLDGKNVNEADCRQIYLDMITGEATPLKARIKACLHNDPQCRPSVTVLINSIVQVMVCSYHM